MRFLIISDAPTLKKDNKQFSYAPYVNEMNLWTKYFDEVVIVSPTKYKKKLLVESFKSDLKVISIPAVSLVSFFQICKSLLVLPYLFLIIFINMMKADHIHLRNPGSIGLISCFVQIFFPLKSKTSKYAGNWDPQSKQPLSYRIQKWILSNTFLTKNCKVLVYGEWKNQTKNIVSFFTASYKKNEIEIVNKKDFNANINFIFVGTFSKGKQPLLSVKVIENLHLKGFNVKLNMYGDGDEYLKIKKYINKNNLNDVITLHGNKPKEIIKNAFKESHFLLFISQSEGWPKVVAEAMFWRCLPISSNVSCVNYMLDYSKRGSVLKSNVSENEVVKEVLQYLNNEDIYQKKVLEALIWSQKYTLDKFELEIKNLLNN